MIDKINKTLENTEFRNPRQPSHVIRIEQFNADTIRSLISENYEENTIATMVFELFRNIFYRANHRYAHTDFPIQLLSPTGDLKKAEVLVKEIAEIFKKRGFVTDIRFFSSDYTNVTDVVRLMVIWPAVA